MAEVPLKNVVRRHGPIGVVQGTDPKVAHNEFAVLVGPPEFAGKMNESAQVCRGFRADALMPKGHALADSGAVADLDLQVTLAAPLGSETMLFSELAGVETQARTHSPRPVSRGETLPFGLHVERCRPFDAETDQSLRGL